MSGRMDGFLSLSVCLPVCLTFLTRLILSKKKNTCKSIVSVCSTLKIKSEKKTIFTPEMSYHWWPIHFGLTISELWIHLKWGRPRMPQSILTKAVTKESTVWILQSILTTVLYRSKHPMDISIRHRAGTSVDSVCFWAYQSILTMFYNGGLWENIF